MRRRRSPSPSTNISVSLPVHVAVDLLQVAANSGRTRSAIVTEAVAAWLAVRDVMGEMRRKVA